MEIIIYKRLYMCNPNSIEQPQVERDGLRQSLGGRADMDASVTVLEDFVESFKGTNIFYQNQH